jgi:polyphosphate kinase
VLGADASAFFNAITGYSQPHNYRKLAAAPISLRDRVLELIASESERCKQGQKSLIMAKINSLADPKIIDALYAASRAGVEIRLNVRGICCLRPGVKRLSENIRVVSIVDRYLEHSRILYFRQGGEEKVFISSADWMPRNLDRRLELLVPVEDVRSRDRLIHVLETCFADTVKGRELLGDGKYRPVQDTGRPLRSQETLFEEARMAIKELEKLQRTVFEPHLPAGQAGP